MSLWRWLRQSDQIDAYATALDEKIRDERSFRDERAGLAADLDRERRGRISAETLSVERRAEVERLIAELAAVRAELSAITTERLKSLDALNVKLMGERVEEKLPDMEQYKKMEALGVNAVRQVRQIHHNMDAAILTKLHPRFAKMAGVVMNETMETQPAAD